MTTPTSHWPEGTPQPVAWPEVMVLFRAHTEAESAALEAMIESFGVLMPPVLMPDGRMVDGYQRWWLAAKLNKPLPLPTVLRDGTTDDEGLILAVELQLGGRNAPVQGQEESS